MSIDIADLKTSINLIDIAGQYTELRKVTNGEYHGPCPFCGGDDRFWVQKEKFGCREGDGHCGRHGDAIEFIKEIKRVDFLEACSILSNGTITYDGAPLKPVVHSTNGHSSEYEWDAEKRKEELLKSHEQLLQASAKGAKEVLAYLESRGLTLDTIKAFKLGYKGVTLPNSDQRELAVAIPWFDQNGCLVSIKYRFLGKHTYTDKDGKERTESKTSRGSSRGHAFGWHSLRNSNTLVIVEGEINDMSIWQVTSFDVLSPGSMQMFNHLPEEVIALAEGYTNVIVWTDEEEFTKAAALKLGAKIMATEKDANELLIDGELQNKLAPDKVKDLEKLAYPYDVVGGCIGEWRERKLGKNETEDYFQPLCNFNAWIVADVAADDGEEISRKIAIAGQLANGAALPEIEIPADEFEAMKWPVALWGARISIEPIKNANNLLRAAIQRLSVSMADRRTLTHTGWTVINDQRVFLHAGGAIGCHEVSVKLPRNLNNYRFPADDAIDPVTAMQESIKLLDVAPARVSMPIWAAMFLGPLSEIIAPVFTVNVEGGSGSLKSSYCAVMLNHYGAKFHEYAMPADWLGTVNSLEKLCFHAKDVTLIIDDYKPSTDAKENHTASAAVSRIVRAVGNRQGRSRLDQNAEFKREYIPRGVVLMTAEKKAVGKSTLSRIITVDVEPGDIDSKMLAQCQKQRHIYAYAMRDFIRYVTREWEHLNQVLPAQVAEIRAAAAMYGHHRRLPNATSILFVAFNCAMAYAVEIGAITQSAADQYMMHFYEALKDLAELQNEATENEDPGKRYLITVASLIAQGKAHIGVKPGNESLIPLGNRNAERLGWHDGESVFFLPGAYNAVCKYASAEGQMFPSDEVTLRKELDRGGWIVKKTDGRLTTKQRQPGGSVINVLAVALDRFAEVLESLGVDL